MKNPVLALLGALVICQPAQALEVYAKTGFPLLSVGVAQPIQSNFTVRGEYANSFSVRDGTVSEEGIRYDADGRFGRVGLFGDWFVMGGGFRLTGGLTFNDAGIDLTARSDTGTVDIGGTTYTLGPNDGFDVSIDYPSTTPYIGIGWGHHDAGPGWSFSADLGVMIGTAKVTAVARGALAAQPGIQQDIDREIQELRDGVGSVRAIPQLTIGIGYRF